MPLYEYTCKKCGNKFEFLHGFDDEPRCPKCKSKNLEKHFSTFKCDSDAKKPGDSCNAPPPKQAGG